LAEIVSDRSGAADRAGRAEGLLVGLSDPAGIAGRALAVAVSAGAEGPSSGPPATQPLEMSSIRAAIGIIRAGRNRCAFMIL
jgi:hypothetical protein